GVAWERRGLLLAHVLVRCGLEPVCRERQRGHLHVVVRVHVRGRHVEPGPHPVEDRPHHLALVLQRAALADEQPDFEGADNHRGPGVRGQESGKSRGRLSSLTPVPCLLTPGHRVRCLTSILKASMTSSTFTSSNPVIFMPHSNPSRTSRTSSLTRLRLSSPTTLSAGG